MRIVNVPRTFTNVPSTKSLRDEFFDFLAEQFFAKISEDAFGLRIDEPNGPSLVDDNRSVRGMLEKRETASRDIFERERRIIHYFVEFGARAPGFPPRTEAFAPPVAEYLA